MARCTEKGQYYLMAARFLSDLSDKLRSNNIFLNSNWDPDHICYRVDSYDSYLQMKTFMQSFCNLLVESPVNGRPISTFELKEPFHFFDKKIYLVELPAPKPGKLVEEGFEHIEIVALDSLENIKQKFSCFSVNEKGLEKDLNKELEFQISNSMSIKFHRISLKSVVCLEQNKKIFSAIKNSRVLSVLHRFSPDLVGTFPLGVSTISSDVDIVIRVPDFYSIENVISQELNHLLVQKNYKVILDNPVCLVRFVYEDVPFEIFIEKTVNQGPVRSLVHFNIEERLLKHGGVPLLKQINNLRSQGFKTEPAFAKALGITENPYLELEKLASQDDFALLQFIHSSARE